MIGVFDSGIGGLTVVKEIFRQLPGYGVVYFGDTARYPYGVKSKATIERFSLENAYFLLDKGAKMIVVACNTASALATEVLRRELDVPVFEVVGPAVDHAVTVTKGNVGMIGTRGTVRSGIYKELMGLADPGITVQMQACPLFVPLVEEGWYDTPETRSIAASYLGSLRKAQIDTLILGCTHYPFLKPVIAGIMGEGVQLIDPAKDMVERIKVFFKSEPMMEMVCRRNRRHRFYASDNTEQFTELATAWLGTKIVLTETRLR